MTFEFLPNFNHIKSTTYCISINSQKTAFLACIQKHCHSSSTDMMFVHTTTKHSRIYLLYIIIFAYCHTSQFVLFLFSSILFFSFLSSKSMTPKQNKGFVLYPCTIFVVVCFAAAVYITMAMPKIYHNYYIST